MERFTQWIIMTHSTNTGNTDLRNVVLTAHFGTCQDHIYSKRHHFMNVISGPDTSDVI